MASRVHVNGRKVGKKKKMHQGNDEGDKVKGSSEHTSDPRIYELKGKGELKLYANYELFLLLRLF